MKLTNFLVIASALATKTCRSEIVIDTASPDESTANLVKDLVKIVTSCYGDRLKTVGLAGNLPDALTRTLSTKHLIPVVLLDDARNYTSKPFFVPVRFRHKIDVFIIEASTPQQLDVIIQMNIKSSIWWNNLASFLVVDRSPGCVNAGNFLQTAWYRDALHAKVLCYGKETARTVYNYNPYTHQAPVPWQQYAVKRGIIDHPFIVFYQYYRANESICMNLDFDKTKDLGGYEIRVHGTENVSSTYPNGLKQLIPSYQFKHLIREYRKIERMLPIISRALNGTTKFSHKREYQRFNTKNDDINMFFVLKIVESPDQLTTYPHTYTGYILISQFRGYKSQLEKIFPVIDIGSWIGLGIVSLITIIFFKFFVHQSIMPAILNMIRITCNTGLTNVPDNMPLRIYIGCLLMFTIIMQVVIQCYLVAKVSTNVPLQNVNTIEDLEIFDYKMCTTSNMYNFLGQKFKGQVILPRYMPSCFEHVKNDTSIALFCNNCDYILDETEERNLHVSPEFIVRHYEALKIRSDWALEQPFNRIMAQLVEADELFPWDSRFDGTKLSYSKFDGTVKNNVDYKPLDLDEMAFAFAMLGIGLAGATVAFIFESVIRYKCSIRITIDRRYLKVKRGRRIVVG